MLIGLIGLVGVTQQVIAQTQAQEDDDQDTNGERGEQDEGEEDDQDNGKVGEAYRQAYYAGHAENWGKVLSLTESAIVPAASCDGNCLLTEDTTPLEPDLL